MEVIHHGGKHTVTGSCHELRDSGQAVLIDCGLFQGKEVQGKTHALLISILKHPTSMPNC